MAPVSNPLLFCRPFVPITSFPCPLLANYVNAPRRDVSAVGGGGAIWRFVADNPGPWFFHWCVLGEKVVA
jgi:hypothetical protein